MAPVTLMWPSFVSRRSAFCTVRSTSRVRRLIVPTLGQQMPSSFA
jgi:hypothetical protein